MTDIFKKAKFGDAFVCRNGWRLLFITKDEEKALLLKQGTPHAPKDILYTYNLSGRMILDGEVSADRNTVIRFKSIPLVKLKLKKMSIKKK